APPMAKTDAPLAPAAEEDVDGGFQPFGEDGLTFLDLIDIINPLQHIPGIATLYRNWSGDTIDPVSQIAGSTLYFGPIGAAVAAANVAVKASTGRDVGEHLVAWFNEDKAINSKMAAIENDPETRTVTSTVVPVAGTDAEDPVTTWARSELAYRTQLAGQQGLTSPRPTSTASADTTASIDTLAWQITPATELEPFSLRGTSRSAHQLLAAYGVAPTSLSTAAATRKPHVSSDDRPQFKRGSDAYRQVAGTWIKPDLTKPTPLAASDAKANPAGAIAPDGGWFSTTMLNALTRYEDKAVAPSTPRRPRISLVN
ncbi:MAG: hypothetical protein VX990_03625, partial [Pseudomonadota bacterium]|nr:hypothetical protein [Pseudomonadota bacterium]